MSAVRAKLPEILRRLLAPHEDDSEFMTALMTTLVVAGGLIPNVWATYDRRRIYNMLMLFVICPPAGGKGVVSLGGKLLERINKHLSETHKADFATYQHRMEEYRATLTSDELIKLPSKPKRSQLLVPGNITSSKLIQQIADNAPYPTVILETEADVLAGAFKSDHGRLMSTTLRQAYHHERISLARKTNDELIEIDTPKVALVISGTDNQVLSIFNGNQDGLFSRFMFLRNNASIKWRSVKPKAGAKPLDDHYEEWSERFFTIWQQAQNLQAEVTFTESHWDVLDKFGEGNQAASYLTGGDYSVGIARRHALMVIRMAMTLSFFRRINPDTDDIGDLVSDWDCKDEDFDLALLLTEQSFQMSLSLFKAMPQAMNVRFENTKRTAFWAALPTHFEMGEATLTANELGIAERTKTRWISGFRGTGMLEQMGRGEYRKTGMATVATVALSLVA
ncbi:DUF3987 domain-containing protein [Spirosoma pollinicola]|nr:DUF3987 domain-containing protein [Spirosoma pollinicola]